MEPTEVAKGFTGFESFPQLVLQLCPKIVYLCLDNCGHNFLFTPWYFYSCDLAHHLSLQDLVTHANSQLRVDNDFRSKLCADQKSMD